VDNLHIKLEDLIEMKRELMEEVDSLKNAGSAARQQVLKAKGEAKWARENSKLLEAELEHIQKELDDALANASQANGGETPGPPERASRHAYVSRCSKGPCRDHETRLRVGPE